MDSKRGIILAVAVFIVVIALIGGSIYYLTRILRSSTTDTTTTTTTSNTVVTSSPSTTTAVGRALSGATTIPNTGGGALGVNSSDSAIYNGRGFSLVYPKNWGLLTCNNSENFELDPSASGKQVASCNAAVKPITVLVDSGYACQGESVTLGGKRGVKLVRQVMLQETGQPITEYQWCFSAGGRNLYISHRVSPNNGLATSKEDYSSQIEQMISASRP